METKSKLLAKPRDIRSYPFAKRYQDHLPNRRGLFYKNTRRKARDKDRRASMQCGYLNASHAMRSSSQSDSCWKANRSDAQGKLLALPRWIRRVRRVLMVVRRRLHSRLVDKAFLLRRICLEHDASLRRICSERTGHRLTRRRWREALGVIWAAHKQQRVDCIFLCLLARHAEDALAWGAWSGAYVTEVLSLAQA
jgi:hypothetical protein